MVTFKQLDSRMSSVVSCVICDARVNYNTSIVTAAREVVFHPRTNGCLCGCLFVGRITSESANPICTKLG